VGLSLVTRAALDTLTFTDTIYFTADIAARKRLCAVQVRSKHVTVLGNDLAEASTTCHGEIKCAFLCFRQGTHPNC
jgi:hypothetical protein